MIQLHQFAWGQMLIICRSTMINMLIWPQLWGLLGWQLRPSHAKPLLSIHRKKTKKKDGIFLRFQGWGHRMLLFFWKWTTTSLPQHEWWIHQFGMIFYSDTTNCTFTFARVLNSNIKKLSMKHHETISGSRVFDSALPWHVRVLSAWWSIKTQKHFTAESEPRLLAKQ